MACTEHSRWPHRTFFVVAILAFCVLQTCNSANLADELRITLDQKAALDKLRERMLPHITESWMKDDLTFVRFLRATNFKLDEAQRKIMETIKWRKNLKMATLHSEDYSDMMEEFPWVMTHAKNGEPIDVAYVGEWDFRNAVITGRGDRLSMHVYRAIEMANRNVRELQLQGQNVTRFNIIFDMGGFNLVQHACAECIVRILEAVLVYDRYYPGSVNRVILVNTPASLAAIVNAIRNVANPATFARVKLYGHDKSVWQKILFEFIDKKNLPVELGGTMSRAWSR